jgi:rubredoxin
MSTPTAAAPVERATGRKWMCANCGYVYEQDRGDPSGGIAPNTAWEDIPDTWRCPDCGASKDDFEMVEL